MNALAASPPVTAEQLLAMPEADHCELIDGELVEKSMGALSCAVAAVIVRLLGEWNLTARLGIVFAQECGYRCFPDRPDMVRRPDASFIRTAKLPEGIPSGFISAVPDLVVEVVSPNDLAVEVNKKVHLYRAAGVPLIWLVFPDIKTVAVYRADGSSQLLDHHGVLSGEGVLPGFSSPVRELFPELHPAS